LGLASFFYVSVVVVGGGDFPGERTGELSSSKGHSSRVT